MSAITSVRVCVVAACALAALLASAQAESAPPGVVSATATLHPDNSLIAEIAVELDASGRVYVEYHGPAGTLQDNPDSFFLFLDRAGRIVWYHRNRPVVANPPTPIRAVRQKPNHNLVYWEGGPTSRFVNCCLREMDPLGRVVTRLVNNDIDKWPTTTC